AASECVLSLISGRVKLGACNVPKVWRWSARSPKYQVEVAASYATGCCTSEAKAVRLNQVTPPSLFRNSVCRALGIGKQSSSRHTPCGLTANRVARVKSEIEIQSWRAVSSYRAWLTSVLLSSYTMLADIFLPAAG